MNCVQCHSGVTFRDGQIHDVGTITPASGQGIGATLRYTLGREDAPEISYVEEAGALNPFRIYGRRDEPCPRCRRPIARIEMGGRGTYFCPGCQRSGRARP